jgi:hypothetical protein
MAVRISAEPFRLPWKSGRTRGFLPGTEIAEIKGPVRIWALAQPSHGRAVVDVYSDPAGLRQRVERRWEALDGDSMDDLKSLCEEFTGLSLALLGLPRPGSEESHR